MKDIRIEGKNIFVVDDDPLDLELIQHIFDRSGLTAHLFLTGEAMLDAACHHLPDLVLLDIGIPGGLNGFEICRQLKNDPALEEIPVIFLSGSEKIKDKVSGFTAGARDYIPKPVVAEELIARLKTHLVNSQLEKQLKASEAKYRSMMESMVDFVYIFSSDFIVEYMNPAMIRRVGGSDAVGKHCYAALHGFEKPCDWCAVDKMQAGCPVDSQFVSPLDNRRFQMTTIPIYHDSGTMSKMAIMRDVTEYWNAVEAKRKSEAQLLQSQKLKSIGQLAAGIAHEINTPIQYIKDNTDFLKTAFSDLLSIVEPVQNVLDAAKSGSLSNEIIEKLETSLEDSDVAYHQEEIPLAIQQSVDGAAQIAKIVRSMKEFSHPGEDKVLVDINQALENTVTISKNEWKYCSDLTCDFDMSLPKILCVPSEINQVFLNIIVNAAQAIEDVVGSDTGHKGRIHVQTRQKDNWVQIRIQDTGTGISPENLNRIFDPFFTTKQIGKGIGQGLSISHATIVEKHAGKIECESETGKGSAFIVSLPVLEKTLTDSYMHRRYYEKAPSRQLTVLPQWHNRWLS